MVSRGFLVGLGICRSSLGCCIWFWVVLCDLEVEPVGFRWLPVVLGRGVLNRLRPDMHTKEPETFFLLL